jgi:hypothetical protein
MGFSFRKEDRFAGTDRLDLILAMEIEAGEKYGIKMLSPEEAKRALPHFGGLGANLTEGQPEYAKLG